MKFICNIDSEEYFWDGKPSNEEVGLIRNRLCNEKSIKEVTQYELAYAISRGCTFTPCAMEGTKTTDWVSQQIYALDFDNGLSLNLALERCKTYGIKPFLYYNTFSSSKEVEKFRLVFCMQDATNDLRVRYLIQTALETIFPEKDGSCTDPARLFFGTDKLTGHTENDEIVIDGLDEDEPVNSVYNLIQSVVMYLRDNDTNNNYNRKVKKFCENTGVNIINGIPYIFENKLANIKKIFDANAVSSILYNIEVNAKTSTEIFDYLVENDYIVSVDNEDTNIYFSDTQVIPIIQTRKKVKIQNYKNNFKDEEIQRFNFTQLDSSCQLWHEYISGTRHISHDEYFGIVTALWRVKGAQKRIIQALDDNEHYNESYNNKVNTLNSVKSYGYRPMACSKFCPHYNDCQCNNLLLAVKPKRAQIRDLQQKIVLYPLKEAQYRLQEAIRIVLEDNSNTIWVIKAATGSGKTQGIFDRFMMNTSYSVPDHQLKDDIERRFKKLGHMVFQKKLGLHDKSIQAEFERLQNISAYALANKEIQKYVKQLKEDDKKIGLSENAKKDLLAATEYLKTLKEIKTTNELAITTHEKALSLNNPNVDTYIFDEDVVQSSLMKTVEITEPQLNDLIAFSMSLKCPYTTGTLETLKKAVLMAHNAPGIVISIPLHKIDNQEIRKICESYNDKITVNLTDLLNIQGVVCNVIQQSPNSKKPPQVSDPLGIIKREFPDTKCIVLSATANLDIYKALYPNRNIRLCDLSNVETKGKVIFHYKSFSRTYLQNQIDDAIEKITKESPNIRNIITFNKFENAFKKAGFKPICHFGATTGIDLYKGEDLIVAGTPFVDERVYLLYAYCINPKTNITDTMLYAPVRRNGFDFSFMTYNNDIAPTPATKMLQEIQFYLIESELIQAVGRARILWFDCKVHLYSGLPLPGVELYSE